LQLLEALKPDEKVKWYEFCIKMQADMEDDEFATRLIFSDEATFHLSGKVNCHNVRTWSTENPHATIEHQRDSLILNVFCAISQRKVYSPFFMENMVTRISYLDMLTNWLFPQLDEDSDNYIYQQDGALPHFHCKVRYYLNENLPHCWIGRAVITDLSFHTWPPRLPDLTPCDFFLWGMSRTSSTYHPCQMIFKN
jgi:hypothetical protein